MSATGISAPRSGAFATARKGGLTPYEVAQALQMRAAGRGVQTIANVLGRSMEDIGALLAPPPVAPEPEPQPLSLSYVAPPVYPDPPAQLTETWPFGACSHAIKMIVRKAAIVRGCSLQDMTSKISRRDAAAKARSAAYEGIRAAYPDMAVDDIGAIFGRTAGAVHNAIRARRERNER
ncbi:MAG: hypothetical protein EON87_05245 [Brevundimonas sp.]|nr:MAG: hypothetical protein EON87_05245 [Brevundimonas sp.]